MSDVWTVELEKEESAFTAELIQQSGEGYTLPMAGPDVLGGVKPVQKTDDMTKKVGIDENGRLWSEKESEQVIEEVIEKYLQKNPIISEETDPTVPEWARQPEKPTYTAEEVGALPADSDIMGPQGPQGEKGEPGEKGKDGVIFIPSVSNGILSWSNDGGLENPPDFDFAGAYPVGIQPPETAEVGQTIVVKAVDENGRPTEWEAADFPSGGDKWEFICDITTTEEIDAGIEITENSEGIQLSELKYNEIWIMAKMVGVATNTNNWWKSVCYGHPMGIGQDYQNMSTNGASGGGTTGTRYVSYYHFIRGNKLYWTDCTKTDVFYIAGGDQAWINNYLDNYHFDYFNKVVIEADSSRIIGVDTEIRILGRRA